MLILRISGLKQALCLYVAIYNLGKVRLELMQSVVFPCTVCDLWGSPFGDLQGFCVALPFPLQCCLLIFADLLRSICESLRILAASPPPNPAWLHVAKCNLGEVKLERIDLRLSPIVVCGGL